MCDCPGVLLFYFKLSEYYSVFQRESISMDLKCISHIRKDVTKQGKDLMDNIWSYTIYDQLGFPFCYVSSSWVCVELSLCCWEHQKGNQKEKQTNISKCLLEKSNPVWVWVLVLHMLPKSKGLRGSWDSSFHWYNLLSGTPDNCWARRLPGFLSCHCSPQMSTDAINNNIYF